MEKGWTTQRGLSKICFFEVLFCFFLFQFAFEIYNDNFDPLAQGDWREIKVEKDLALIPTFVRINGEEALEITQLQWNDSNNNKIDLRNKPRPTHDLNLHILNSRHLTLKGSFFLPIFTARSSQVVAIYTFVWVYHLIYFTQQLRLSTSRNVALFPVLLKRSHPLRHFFSNCHWMLQDVSLSFAKKYPKKLDTKIVWSSFINLNHLIRNR